jgi:hypothetical protein
MQDIWQCSGAILGRPTSGAYPILFDGGINKPSNPPVPMMLTQFNVGHSNIEIAFQEVPSVLLGSRLGNVNYQFKKAEITNTITTITMTMLKP